jgi:hypothetical protein
VGTRLSAPVHTGLGAHPSSYTKGKGLSWGQNGSGVALTPTPSTDEIEGRLELLF